MTSRSDVGTFVNDMLQLRGTGEALIAAANLMLPAAEACAHVIECDDSPDLVPEMRTAIEAIEAAGDAIKRAAIVVEGRYELAERQFEATTNEEGNHA